MSQRNAVLSNLLSKYSSQPVDQFQHDSDQYQNNIGEGQALSERNYEMTQRQDQLDYDENNNQMGQRRHLNDEEELDECFHLLLSQDNNQMKSKHQKIQKIEQLSYSQTKIMTPPKQKPSKKQKKQKQCKNQPKPKFYNPLDHSILLQIKQSDLKRLANIAKEHLNQDSKLSDELQKLGMKNSKVLGMIRSRKELQNIAGYLESGAMPAEYAKKLQEIIGVDIKCQ